MQESEFANAEKLALDDLDDVSGGTAINLVYGHGKS